MAAVDEEMNRRHLAEAQLSLLPNRADAAVDLTLDRGSIHSSKRVARTGGQQDHASAIADVFEAVWR